jgi:hypothetical protein
MSTTFEVFPQLPLIPTFRQIVDLSTTRLHQYLSSYGIDSKYRTAVTLRRKDPDAEQPTDLASPASWTDDLYAWFYVPSVSGGTDAYFWELEEDDREMVLEEFRVPELPEGRRRYILACLGNDHYWHFRRSAGQPAIINVAYGLIAASVAELTGGFIYSIDGGWEYKRFPATAEEFYQWYFRPEQAIQPEEKQWAEKCLKIIAGESEAHRHIQPERE